MLLCIAVTHEFLIRIYLLMKNQLQTEKWKLKIYIRTLLILLATDFVADGLNVCENDYSAVSYFTLSLKIRKTVISAILCIINFLICHKVVT